MICAPADHYSAGAQITVKVIIEQTAYLRKLSDDGYVHSAGKKWPKSDFFAHM